MPGMISISSARVAGTTERWARIFPCLLTRVAQFWSSARSSSNGGMPSGRSAFSTSSDLKAPLVIANTHASRFSGSSSDMGASVTFGYDWSQLAVMTAIDPHLGSTKRRRGRDSNPRDAFRRLPVFKTGAFNRSATPPGSKRLVDARH